MEMLNSVFDFGECFIISGMVNILVVFLCMMIGVLNLESICICLEMLSFQFFLEVDFVVLVNYSVCYNESINIGLVVVVGYSY